MEKNFRRVPRAAIVAVGSGAAKVLHFERPYRNRSRRFGAERTPRCPIGLSAGPCVSLGDACRTAAGACRIADGAESGAMRPISRRCGFGSDPRVGGRMLRSRTVVAWGSGCGVPSRERRRSAPSNGVGTGRAKAPRDRMACPSEAARRASFAARSEFACKRLRHEAAPSAAIAASRVLDSGADP